MARTLLMIFMFILSVGAKSSIASTIEGDSVNLSIYVPTISTKYEDLGTHTILAGGTSFIMSSQIDITVTPTAILLAFFASGSGNSSLAFDGYIFQDLTQAFPAVYFVDPLLTTVAASTFDFATVGNKFELNFARTTLKSGDTIAFTTVAPVPEPSMAVMALAGLPLIGGAIRRLRRTNRA